MIIHFKSLTVGGACCKTIDKSIKVTTLHKDMVTCKECKGQREYKDFNEKNIPKELSAFENSLSYKLRKMPDLSVTKHSNVTKPQRGRPQKRCKLCNKELVNKICPDYTSP